MVVLLVLGALGVGGVLGAVARQRVGRRSDGGRLAGTRRSLDSDSVWEQAGYTNQGPQG